MVLLDSCFDIVAHQAVTYTCKRLDFNLYDSNDEIKSWLTLQLHVQLLLIVCDFWLLTDWSVCLLLNLNKKLLLQTFYFNFNKCYVTLLNNRRYFCWTLSKTGNIKKETKTNRFCFLLVMLTLCSTSWLLIGIASFSWFFLTALNKQKL